MIGLLLDRGARLDVRDNRDETAFQAARRRGQREALALFAEKAEYKTSGTRAWRSNQEEGSDFEDPKEIPHVKTKRIVCEEVSRYKSEGQDWFG